ncbi:MAG: hypothetical protein ACO3RV_08200 [Luteolibacter sp.]
MPISLVDLFASFAALTGSKLPSADVGAEDSHNVLPSFFYDNSSAPLRPAIVGHSGWGVFSIRKGPWKWIEGKHSTKERPKGGDDQLVPQLYNLAEDPGERHNVLSQHPEIAAELSALLETWRKQGRSRP